MTRLPAIALFAVLAITACGNGSPTSGKSSRPGQSPDATPSASASATPTAPPSGGHSAAPGSTTPKPRASSGNQPAPAPSDFLIASVTKPCITPGQTQELDVQTWPSSLIAYNTLYADGKSGFQYGGEGADQVDSKGYFTATWTIIPTTPRGDATIDLTVNAGQDKQATGSVKFRVAGSC